MTAPRLWRARGLGLGLLALSVALAVLGAAVGSTGLESMASVWGDSTSAQIVWDIRLPRSLGAWAAGALLGLGGAIAQGLFRNPLADPYLLGSASGASLGVATAMALFGVTPMASAWAGRLGLTSAAFVGAVGAVVLTLVLARGVQHTIRLLLAGVVVGVVLGAVGSLVLLLSPQTLLAMQTFMLGSTSFVGWGACVLMVLVWLLCTGLAWWMAPVLDGLALGESTARSLGLPLERTRALLVVLLGLSTATAVAQTGLIAFVGLAAPHVVRALVRCSQGTVLLLSSAMGGVLLMAADLLARGLVSPLELPVGLLTAVLGGGYLLWLMRRGSPTRFGGTP